MRVGILKGGNGSWRGEDHEPGGELLEEGVGPAQKSVSLGTREC